MAKEYRVMFRADETLLERIEKLGSKLGLGRGEVLRLCVEQTVEKYLNLEGSLVILDREKFDAIIKGLSRRLAEEVKNEITEKVIEQVQKSPETQKFRKAAKAGKLEIIKKP